MGSAQPERAAVIVHAGVIGDRMEWQIQFPLLVTYENENETHTEHLMVTALVVRTSDTAQPGWRGDRSGQCAAGRMTCPIGEVPCREARASPSLCLVLLVRPFV